MSQQEPGQRILRHSEHNADGYVSYEMNGKKEVTTKCQYRRSVSEEYVLISVSEMDTVGTLEISE